MFEDEVQRGMELIGDRWSEIDTDILQMHDTEHCVLGQLTGWYWSKDADRVIGYTGPNLMNLEGADDELVSHRARHRLACSFGLAVGQLGENLCLDEYAILTSEWRRALRAKREEADLAR